MTFFIPDHLAQAARKVQARAETIQQAQIAFLADLIRLKTYTGEEGPAIERTLTEMKALAFSDVRTDTIGDALAEVGDGSYHLLYDAHLDENEIADENDWPYPRWNRPLPKANSMVWVHPIARGASPPSSTARILPPSLASPATAPSLYKVRRWRRTPRALPCVTLWKRTNSRIPTLCCWLKPPI